MNPDLLRQTYEWLHSRIQDPKPLQETEDDFETKLGPTDQMILMGYLETNVVFACSNLIQAMFKYIPTYRHQNTDWPGIYSAFCYQDEVTGANSFFVKRFGVLLKGTSWEYETTSKDAEVFESKVREEIAYLLMDFQIYILNPLGVIMATPLPK